MSLSIRQQKYKKNRILGMNCYNAARSAGYSEATAKSRTKDLEARVKIADVLERQGLTDNVLVGKLIELIEASKFVTITVPGYESEKVGNTPDWTARAKGLELALKLKDLLKEKIVDLSQHTTNVTINKIDLKERIEALRPNALF